MLSPSGLTALRSALATRLAVTMAAFRSSSSDSKSVGAWFLVTTRQWPEFSGLMSMKHSVRASSYTFRDGICPSRILQNTQSVMRDSLRPRGRRGSSLVAPRARPRPVDDHPSGRHRPSARVGCGTGLDGDDGVVEPLGQLADAAAVDHDALALEGQLADRGDDGGGARAPDLLQRPLAGRLADLVDRHGTLGHAQAPLTHEGQRRVARHAGQDRALERRRDDLVADLEHDIHRAHFFDVLAVHTVEPEHLREALVLRLLGGVHRKYIEEV